MPETEDGFEMARRELCPDETCVGLIGTDGRCKECGSVGVSQVADPRHQGMERVDPDGAVDDDDDGDRVLCPDGSCVGLLGADGRCKVCGIAGEMPLSRGPRAVATRPVTAPSTAADAGSPGPIEVDDDDDRELCPDGGCVGLIGPDGRCKVCKTPRLSGSTGQP